MPLAYFITFHTYGTWFHGDNRGSVAPGHNQPGTPTIAPDQRRVDKEAATLRQPPFIIDDFARTVIDRAIREIAIHRSWKILALNIRTNHVHIVITAPDHTPERVMNDLKAWSTPRLRDHTCISPDTRVWSRHGSTRWLNTTASFNRACEYAANEQGPNLPMSVPGE